MLPALFLPFQWIISFAGFYPKTTPATSVALFRNIFLVEFTRWRWWLFQTSCASTDSCISLPGQSCNHSCTVLQYMGQCLGLPCTGSALRQALEKVLSGQGEGSSLPTQLPNFSPVFWSWAFQHLHSFPPRLSSCFCDSWWSTYENKFGWPI